MSKTTAHALSLALVCRLAGALHCFLQLSHRWINSSSFQLRGCSSHKQLQVIDARFPLTALGAGGGWRVAVHNYVQGECPRQQHSWVKPPPPPPAAQEVCSKKPKKEYVCGVNVCLVLHFEQHFYKNNVYNCILASVSLCFSTNPHSYAPATPPPRSKV